MIKSLSEIANKWIIESEVWNELLLNVVFKTRIKKELNQTQMALKYYQTKISLSANLSYKPLLQFPCTCNSLFHIERETLSNMSTDAIIDFKDTLTAWVVCNHESFNNTL